MQSIHKWVLVLKGPNKILGLFLTKLAAPVTALLYNFVVPVKL